MKQKKSQLVTIVGWIMVGLSGIGMTGAFFQNLLIHFVFPIDHFQKIFESQIPFEGFPTFLFTHIKTLYAIFLGISIIWFVGSLGFVQRKNWGRHLVSTFGILSILYLVGGLFLQMQFIQGMQLDMPPNEMFDSAVSIMRIFSIIFTVVISALIAWGIYAINSGRILAEFRAARSGMLAP